MTCLVPDLPGKIIHLEEYPAQGFVDIFDHFHDFMTWHNVIIGWLSNKESN